ncbi:MAG: protein kinase [Gemmatimonadota bacterium]
MTDMLARLTTSLSDRYRIERELGQGGMATVYLAEDLKHERKVAIKVLRPELAAVIGAERFLREIKTIATLQHPHILGLIDSGEVNGTAYYVMPFVEGESLRDRLNREKQLPINDAIRIAIEVAGALDYAHRHGVIHRDIKPENILLHDGSALVADFGIALAVSSAGGSRMTETGMSLGTPHYMSPEQAMGEREITARSDVYALGVVTYEMLTGDPPFTGSTAQAIVAKVVTEKPVPPSRIRDTVPDSVEDAVLVALAKLPADRFGSAAEFAAQLTRDPTTVPSRFGVRDQRRDARLRARFRDPLVLGLAAFALAMLIVAGVLARRSATDEPGFPFRVELPLPPGGAASGQAAISPDGHSLAYVALSPSGQGTSLYLRRLDQRVARVIPGTDNASGPVFSPDGKSVAFIVNRRKLVRAPLDGGPVLFLGEVPDDGGIDWSSNGEIVIGAGVIEGLKGLSRVDASGGTPRPLTQVDTARKELSHNDPRVLPDGKTVLFTIWYGTVDRAELGATSLDDGKVTPLGVLGARALGVVDGKLIYVRADGTAMSVPFDLGRRRVSGNAVPVLDSIRMFGGNGSAGASMSSSGALVYATGTLHRRLMWTDRSGAAREALDESREYTAVRLSPDGRRAAVSIAAQSGSDLWIFDVTAGTLTPFTTTQRSRPAAWSPDGRSVLYVSTQGGRAAFWWQSADGGPARKAGEARHNPWNVDLSPDGHTTVFNSVYDGTFNVETYDLDSTHAERDVSASPAAVEGLARFAPDGRSIAYTSDESGRREIYLRLFPDVEKRIQVSTAGGIRPVWARDGNALYYWQGNKLIAAHLARAPVLRISSRETLFEGKFVSEFDVSPDDKRFLMIEPEAAGLSLVMIPSWRTELRQLTGGKSP